MQPLPTDLAAAIINASPIATAIVACNGAVICINPALEKMFERAEHVEKLTDFLDTPKKFTAALLSAARSSGALPAYITTTRSNRKVSVQITPLDCTSGNPATLYLVTLSGRTDARQKMLSLKLKLDETTIERRILQEQNNTLKNTVKKTIPKLRELSYTDSLTELHNRRFYDKQLQREWQRGKKSKEPVSLIIIDIDHFKRYNDSFGHPKGDECLKQIAAILATTVTRRCDFICRIGGEEFAIVLPMTDADGALRVAQRALRAVHQIALHHADGSTVTISAGVGTSLPGMHEEKQAFVEKVDQALYRSKKLGRDRVTSATEQTLQHCNRKAANNIRQEVGQS